ncbi:hypothetical protein VPH35_116011 [Triticum aestivum]
MELCRRELRLYANTGALAPRWASALFTHLATLDAVAMDPELKTRVRSDLESFLKGRAYYHCLGRVWRRSYLLYGPRGTGKSTFAAAMARFLRYDIYDIDLSRAGADELRALLVDTAPRSLTGGRRAPSALSAAAVLTVFCQLLEKSGLVVESKPELVDSGPDGFEVAVLPGLAASLILAEVADLADLAHATKF